MLLFSSSTNRLGLRGKELIELRWEEEEEMGGIMNGLINSLLTLKSASPRHLIQYVVSPYWLDKIYDIIKL